MTSVYKFATSNGTGEMKRSWVFFHKKLHNPCELVYCRHMI